MFKKVYGKIYFGCFFFFYGKLCLGLFKNIEVKIVTLIMRQKINQYSFTCWRFLSISKVLFYSNKKPHETTS